MKNKFEKFAMSQKQVDAGVAQWLKIGLILNPEEDPQRISRALTVTLYGLASGARFLPKIQHSTRGAALALLHYERGAHFCIVQFNLGGAIPEFNAVDVLRDNQIHENFILMLKPRDHISIKEQLFLQTKCRNYGVWYDGDDQEESRKSFDRAIARVGFNDVPMPAPIQTPAQVHTVRMRSIEEEFFLRKREFIEHFGARLESAMTQLEQLKNCKITTEALQLDEQIEKLNETLRELTPASELQGSLVRAARRFQIRAMARGKK